jgi:hypothetical protein
VGQLEIAFATGMLSVFESPFGHELVILALPVLKSGLGTRHMDWRTFYEWPPGWLLGTLEEKMQEGGYRLNPKESAMTGAVTTNDENGRESE